MDLHGFYLIINKYSMKCLEVANACLDDKALIHQWTRYDGDNQQWQFVLHDDGYYEIIAKHSGKCLDDGNSSIIDGGLIHQWSRHGGDNQKWELQELPDGYFLIISKIGELCVDGTLDIHDGSLVHLWSNHVGENQQWRLVSAETHIGLPSPLSTYSTNITPANHYAEKVQASIRTCTSDIANVSRIAAEIKSQGGWERYWKKSQNIALLADNVATMSSVQQRMLDMMILLMGAAGRMKSDYNIIIESIEDLSKSHSGTIEVLEYLVKIKNTVEAMKRRDELVESLITYTNSLRDSLGTLENNVSSNQVELEARYMNILAQIENVKAGTASDLEFIKQKTDAQISDFASTFSNRFKLVWAMIIIALLVSLVALATKIL
jgi:hypothetical protein